MEFDICVIGGGPAGYNAAIRAAQLGFKTVVIEKRENKFLGGTCLHEGCIPSKTLLNTTHNLYVARNNFANMGIDVKSVEANFPQMQKNKEKVVSELANGIDYLMKKNKIEKITGEAKFISDVKVKVADKEISAKYFIIATGSVPIDLPNIKIDEKNILSSTGALALDKVPNEMVIVGAGVIGIELGLVYNILGCKISIIEYLDEILPGTDLEVSKMARKIFTKKGINFLLAKKVEKVSKKGKKLSVEFTDKNTNKVENISCDKVLLSIGRKPFTDGLGLSEIGVETNERKQIVTNNFMTNKKNIFAIGDVITGPMLAHKAEEDAVAVCEIIAGNYGHVDYNLIPAVIYSSPEIASIGLTEEACKEKNIEYKKAKFPFSANARAKASANTEGFVKIIADAKTDEVLGCHIISDIASELIHEIAVLMAFGGSSQDIALICHAHPTKSEAVRQAAMGIENWTMQM